MVEWESGRPLGAKLFMAERVFKCDVLRILLSEFDKGQEYHTLGIKEKSCASGMFVIIMSVKIYCRTDFVA